MADSTYYDSNYDRSSFIKRYDIQVGKGKQAKTITIQDMLSNEYIELINTCSVDSLYTWKYGDNLPNLSYYYYGTTTAWWIIARKNGIINPFSLKPGDVIQIPSLSSISSLIKDTRDVSELNTKVVY